MANKLPHKLSHTMIRGRTYYTNSRLNDSTSLVRISLGTDSYKQAEILMSQARPFIPLVQNGTMQVAEFKSRLKGFRAATKKDFDGYLLKAVDVADYNEYGLKRHVYSLRHTFISGAIAAGCSSALLQFIVGQTLQSAPS